MKFYPYEKGGGVEKVLAMLKGGGHKKFWGSFCHVRAYRTPLPVSTVRSQVYNFCLFNKS